MTHTNKDKIFKYINDEMTPDEQEQFRESLSNDETLRAEYEEYVQLLEVIKDEGRNQLKNQLALAGKNYDARRRKHKVLVKVCVALLSILFLVSLAVWMKNKKNSQNQPEDISFTDSIIRDYTKPDTMMADTSSKAIHNSVKENIKPVTKQLINTDELFASNFKPCRDASLNPGLRGKAEAFTVAEFMQLYWDKEYDTAISVFNKLPQDSQENINLLFQYANCLAIKNEFVQAQEIFSKVAQDQNGRYASEAQYYNALMLIKLKKLRDAKILLSHISADKSHPFHSASTSLLRKLSGI